MSLKHMIIFIFVVALSSAAIAIPLSIHISSNDNLPSDIGVEYEEIGIDALCIYVYTQTKNIDDLQKIVDYYKEKYKHQYTFAIVFYSNRDHARNSFKGDGSLEDLAFWFASYSYNAHTGYDAIKIYKDSAIKN